MHSGDGSPPLQPSLTIDRAGSGEAYSHSLSPASAAVQHTQPVTYQLRSAKKRRDEGLVKRTDNPRVLSPLPDPGLRRPSLTSPSLSPMQPGTHGHGRSPSLTPLEPSNPSTWPDIHRPVSPSPVADTSPLTTIVHQWMQTHATGIIHEWLNANAARIISQSHVGHGSEHRMDTKDDDHTHLQLSHSPAAHALSHSGMESSPALSPNAASARGVGTSVVRRMPSLTGDGEFSEPDPRSMLGLRNKKRIDESISAAESAAFARPGIGLGLGQNSEARNINPGVERIRESTIAEAGATVQEHKQASSLPRAAAGRQQRPSVSMGSGAGGPDVLLVEDVRMSQKIAHAALSRAHYRVEVASDGESAVDLYRRHAATLRVVLMDIHLPGISGIEATQKIRQIEKAAANDADNAPLLIYGLTGNVAESNLREYQEAGMNGCIVKGKLLVDAVKQATEMSERNPSMFVNLSETAMTNNPNINISTSHRTEPARQPGSASSTASELSSQSSLTASPISPSPISPHPKHSSSPPPAVAWVQPPRPIYVPGSAPGHGPDLLLVEDVRVSQRVAQQALQRIHFRVETASDGESAVDKFRQHLTTLKVILMDIGLPGISGIEATEQIRKIELENGMEPTLIFGLTGNVDESNLREYEQVGMNGCIVKGKLIADAVRESLQHAATNPGRFINLVGRNDSQAQPQSSAGAQPARPVPAPAAAPAAPARQPALLDDDEDARMDFGVNPRLTAINRAAAGTTSDAIGTPRAFMPRQLIREKQFPGSGVTKAGIGLPSANQQAQSQAQPAAPSSPSNELQPMSFSPTQTTTTISQPAAALTTASVGLGVRASSSSGSHGGPDVLLVEDVRVSQRIAQSALQRAHYRVDVASDGESAIEKFRSFSASLRIILMDVGLPGITGIEATERIRQIETQMCESGGGDQRPVLIFGLTGNVAESNLRQYEQAGMNGCIVKGRLLVDAVREAVSRVEREPDVFVTLVAGG